jgi:hypothetical protein
MLLTRSIRLGMCLVLAAPIWAEADTITCQKTIARQLQRFKKKHLKAHLRCLRLDNLGRISGPCPDITAQLKIQRSHDAVVLKIADKCTMSDIAALGFPSDCTFEAATTGVEADCIADHNPIDTPTEFADCLTCWKGAELSEFEALLFASHAIEVCGGSLDATSSVCSDLDCTTPLPIQRDLGDTGENDCQVAIGKGGIRYLLKREKILERCALAGGTAASCLGDLEIQAKLQTAEDRKEAYIQSRCNNRIPTADPPFCCRTGTGQTCTVAATRDDCVNVLGGDVMEDKNCVAGSCDPIPGPNKPITWWENCPENDTCPGPTLANISDLIGCVDSAANAIVSELICFQFPRNGGADWPCPADTD